MYLNVTEFACVLLSSLILLSCGSVLNKKKKRVKIFLANYFRLSSSTRAVNQKEGKKERKKILKALIFKLIHRHTGPSKKGIRKRVKKKSQCDV